MKTKWTLGLLTMFTLLGAVTTYAQDDLLDDLYGRGVHAYNSRNYRDAWTYLDDAISQGSLDPREFYYRGLALTRLGRTPEATADFQRGAEIEATSNAVFPVGRSLARVQGSQRLSLEKYRRNARLAVRKQRTLRDRARYETLQRNEKGVLRGGAPQTLPNLPDAGDEKSNPFVDDNGLADGNPVAAPPRAAAGTELEPAVPDPVPAGGDNIFGGDDGGDDLFGGDDAMDNSGDAADSGDSGDDLFGAGDDDAPNPFD